MVQLRISRDVDFVVCSVWIESENCEKCLVVFLKNSRVDSALFFFAWPRVKFNPRNSNIFLFIWNLRGWIIYQPHAMCLFSSQLILFIWIKIVKYQFDNHLLCASFRWDGFSYGWFFNVCSFLFFCRGIHIFLM